MVWQANGAKSKSFHPESPEFFSRTCNCGPFEIYHESSGECTPMSKEQREVFLSNLILKGLNVTEDNFVLANSLERMCPVGFNNDHKLRPRVRRPHILLDSSQWLQVFSFIFLGLFLRIGAEMNIL